MYGGRSDGYIRDREIGCYNMHLQRFDSILFNDKEDKNDNQS